MNGTFAEYTTSVAFSIQLSKNQCNTLLRIARDFDPKATPMDTKTWMLQVGTLHALEVRGLVYWNRVNGKCEGFRGLTKAGELMVNLLAEAGLTIENTNTTSMIRRLSRAA